MTWLRYLIFALVLLDAGYMVFDGLRALVKGDYLTPSSGAFAGQLGPWSRVAAAVGVDPRSTEMKMFFVIFGTLWLTSAVTFLMTDANAAYWAVFAGAILSLWYLIPGTILSVLIIAALVVLAR